MRESTVAVIIPCHNHGQYLDEAIQSVLKQTYEDVEIIIVDDGSTEEDTIRILDGYERPKTRLIRTVHQGLANARNSGIKASEAEYILPLDCDDKIHCTYLEKAVSVMKANDAIGIVYCRAEYFGEESGPWTLRACCFPEILYENVIFCSALFRRSDWEKVKGYNPNMIYGWEDYDFWLSLIDLGRVVFCIPETLFYYRKRSDSMIKGMSHEQIIHSYSQLFWNHPKLYGDKMGELLWNLNNLTGLQNYYDEEISKLRQDIKELQENIKDVERSLSWKVTRPLRSGKAMLKKLCHPHSQRARTHSSITTK